MSIALLASAALLTATPAPGDTVPGQNLVPVEQTAAAPITALPEAMAAAEMADGSAANEDGNASANADGAGTDSPNEIIVTHRPPDRADPLESVNETSFEVVQTIDKALIGPIATGYRKGTPKPFQQGVHHFLDNLDEPIVFVNFLLQLKIGKALETLARFTINSTVGLAGTIDVAKKHPFHLPRRFNGLADTLGYYGVKQGPYMFLPLIGSTSLRDVFGRVADLSLLPATVGKPFNIPAFTGPVRILSAVDDRAEQDDDIRRLRDNTQDGYASMRDFYLKRRQGDIDELQGRARSDGKPTVDEQLAATWAAEREAKAAKAAATAGQSIAPAVVPQP